MARCESLPAAVRGEIITYARVALRCLDRIEHDPKEAIHELRTRMKRARSLLRLLEKNLPVEVVKEVSTLMRQTKNALAADRDSAVMRDWLRRLRADKGLAELFPSSQVSFSKAVPSLRVSLGEVKSLLRAVSLRGIRDEDICRAFQRSWNRMERAAIRSQIVPSEKNIHEWRKRVKDVWYQGEFLSSQDVRGTRWRRMKKLSSILGDIHDLDVLMAYLQKKGVSNVSALRQAIRDRRLVELSEAMDCWEELKKEEGFHREGFSG